MAMSQVLSRRSRRSLHPALRRPFLLATLIVIVLVAQPSFASAQSPDIPAWLRDHVGDGDGQIARTVLERARALYQQKVSEGAVRNPCYFAMDATRPNSLSDGHLGRRFYIVCEATRSFRAISAGHGAGRDLEGVADFANGRQCAKNFGNAMDSELTAGGAYVTAETKPSFKGYYRSGSKEMVLIRSFLQFEGEGETANARQRAIGGHATVSLHNVCLRRDPGSPYANPEGYVPMGTLVDYAGGRSNGCTSWSPADVPQIIALVKHDPTTLYLYPEAADIDALARSPSRSNVYWDAFCLRAIGAPHFWSKDSLEPAIAAYKREHPAPPPRPTPLCKGQ